jgi:hypothetical protein
LWGDSWPLDDVLFPAQLDHLLHAITTSTAHGCCDSSYMRERSTTLGAAAWKIEDPVSQQSVQGTVQTTSDEQDINAYRSKLQGIHTVLLATAVICTFHRI